MSKATGICPNCGDEFSYYPSAYKRQGGVKTYCSRECLSQHSRIDAVCPHCGKDFWYHRSWPRKFCSAECYSASGKRSANLGEYAEGDPPVAVACDWCGNEFEKAWYAYQNTDHHFCDQSCFGEYLAETRRGVPRPEVSGERPDLQNRVSLTCPICDTKFRVKASHAENRRFCSKGCMAVWQAESISGASNFNWKGGYGPYYGPNWHPQRRKARRRDGHTCQECGITEEETEREHDVHHIIPFREFGIARYKEANALSNLITLCAPCHKLVEHNGLNQ